MISTMLTVWANQHVSIVLLAELVSSSANCERDLLCFPLLYTLLLTRCGVFLADLRSYYEWGEL